jgi:hypothetical protein
VVILKGNIYTDGACLYRGDVAILRECVYNEETWQY